ncbi:MAG: histidine kinase [Treponema sp.]|jgi:sensor histidine kinase YesM|nr:histidine kinase [Treponema sp.]
MKIFHSLKFHYALSISVLIIALIGITSAMNVKQMSEAVSKTFAAQGIFIVEKEASLIDGDSFQKLVNSLDSSDPFYEETRIKLLQLKDFSGCKYLYTLAPKKGNIWQFIIDGSAKPEDVENFSVIGSEEDTSSYDGAFRKAWDFGKTEHGNLVKQEGWGYLISFYIPIINSDGKTVGIAACDYDGEDLYNTIIANIQRQLIIGFFSVAICIVLIFIISKPIQKLTKLVAEIGAGNLDIIIKGNYSNEYNIIKDAVNSMVEEIKKYIEGKLQAERKLNDSRISIIISQIQPHFLYNALTVISRLCDKDPAQAKKATIEFSAYLRGNMDSLEETKPIPFEKELRHIEGFLNLEKAMYGEALNVIYDIKTKDFLLPALTVQSIVENAVKHGIGKREGGGTVRICTSETDNEFFAVVSDNGVGFEYKKTAHDRSLCVGINNVRLRLSVQCGGSLEIESKPGAGTTAAIRIPK